MGTKGMRIGILTAGGDCPGLNAAIRGVGKTAIEKYGMDVIGFSSGFTGLINNDYIELGHKELSNILTLGGTILGTSREKPFKKSELFIDGSAKPDMIKKTYAAHNLDCLVCLGGNGTQKTAAKLAAEGLNVIGIPKTIDNDVWGTDVTFGFHSAVDIATEAIDRLHSTANSHKRVMVIEVMGHHAGWIALYSGIAAGGDLILLPEIEYNEKIIMQYLDKRTSHGKDYSIVVVGEGIMKKKDKKPAGRYISQLINAKTGFETRETVLGYTQRGGSPSAYDRILATNYGAHAAELIAKRKFGQMVAIKHGALTSVPLSEVSNKLKLVSPNDPLVQKARNMGMCFGDKL